MEITTDYARDRDASYGRVGSTNGISRDDGKGFASFLGNIKRKTAQKKAIDEAWQDAENMLMDLLDEEKLDLSEVRKRWKEAKGWMLPYFGEDLRLSKTVENCQIDNEMINAAINSLESMAINLSKNKKYNKAIGSIDEGEEVFYLLKVTICYDFDKEEILENKIHRPWNILNEKGDSSDEFNAGTKIPKVLKGILFDKMFRNTFRIPVYKRSDYNLIYDFAITIYSQFLSKIKVKEAKVVLSIHPVDILLSSMHTSGWRSCHNIYDGEYATGPLSYLCDSTTAIGYSYVSTDFPFQGANCFSKKNSTTEFWKKKLPVKLWRQLVAFDRDNLSAFFLREYPRGSEVYSKIIREMAADVLSRYGHVSYDWLKKDVSYNDSDYKTGPINWGYLDYPTSRIKMKSGGEEPCVTQGVESVPCVKCGKPRELSITNSLICENCYPYMKVYCSQCEESGSLDTMNIVDGEIFCDDCFNYLFATCNCCGEIFEVQNISKDVFGNSICVKCIIKYYKRCSTCNFYNIKENMIENDDGSYHCKEKCDEATLDTKDEISKNTVKILWCQNPIFLGEDSI